LEGTEPSALIQAVSSRCGLEEGSNFYLTVEAPPLLLSKEEEKNEEKICSSSNFNDNNGNNEADDDDDDDDSTDDALVIPLTANLPDGMTLYLRLVSCVVISSSSTIISAVKAEKKKNKVTILPHPTVGTEPRSSQEFLDDFVGKNDGKDIGEGVDLGRSTSRRRNIHHPHRKFQRKLKNVDPTARPAIARLQDYFRTKIKSPFASSLDGTSSSITTILAYNKLGTDLANERTFLAWTRTMLALVRTAFAYQKVFPADDERERSALPSLLAACVITASLMIMAGLYSVQGYYSVRSMLISDQKPDSYSKMALWPFIGLAVSLSLITGVSTYMDAWW